MSIRIIALIAAVAFFCPATLYPQASKLADANWMDVEGLSIPVPPAEHPRLFLRARDIDDLKRRATHPALKKVWEELQQLAETRAQIRIEVDAARYLMTRDTDLGKRTLALALDTLEKSNFPSNVQDITRPIGRMMVTGAIAYDWCYPLLTPEQKEGFHTQLVRLAKQLECGYPPRPFGWVTGHGSEWMVMRDMLGAGVALYDEDPEMYRQAATIFFKELLPARDFWYPGHAFHQGTSYAETRFSSDLYPLWIFDRLGAGNVYHPAQEFVPYQWIYMRRPDGQLLRSGDGQSREPKLRSLLVASYYGDSYVLSDYLKNPGNDAMSKIFEFLWSDPDLKPLPITDLPLSRYMGFPYGWMLARTGWDEDSVIAEMKVNVYNFVNHQHLDAGSFQVYYKGPLAIDSGNYEGVDGGYGSPHHSNYNRRTIAHNSLLIYDPQEKFTWSRSQDTKNDGGQKFPNNWSEPRNLEVLLGRGYKTGTVLGHGFGPDPQTPEYTYLKGDLTEAYSSKVKDMRRAFVFLNLGGRDVPAVLIVFDKVVSANSAFKKYWLLHSMEEPVIEGNVSTLTLTDRGWTGKMVNTTLLPEPGSAEITKVGGPGKEFWVFGENFPNGIPPKRDPKLYEVGAWRVELSPAKPSESDLFLNVMQVMARDTGKPLPVARLESGDLIGVRVADRVVFFNRTGDRTSHPVSFTVSGISSLKCLMTDLAEGTWQVWRDGRIIRPAVTVNGDEGALYFQAPPGNYQLRR